jgi:hypothetical protein
VLHPSHAFPSYDFLHFGQLYIFLVVACLFPFFTDLGVSNFRFTLVSQKNENKQATTKNIYNCPKCKKSYEGKACDGCNTPNPLFNRRPKKVKKKKKKRK